MAKKASVTTKRFQGTRIEAETPLSFEEVLSSLRQSMGDARAPGAVAAPKAAITQAEYIQDVEDLAGESGFMLFHEIDHGSWLPAFGIGRRAVRLILGNPLLAITMIRHDITAALFAPVEVLVTEQEGGQGTAIAYVRPSSLMVIEENAPLREAAEALDRKLDALIAKATGEEFRTHTSEETSHDP